MTERRKIRCAIYTRKSSEEGLEQAFNSLDAQHEACAAYIASQKHEGRALLKDRYDDGGVSGGTLDRRGLRTKHRPGLKGTAAGGARYGRGHLQHLLSNPVYVGRIRHGSITYEGAHHPIVEREMWDAVQARLIGQSTKDRGRTAASAPWPLAVRAIDETGDRLTPSHANKKGRRYRYYVSHRLIAGDDGPSASGWRISAERLEQAFAKVIASRFEDVSFAITLLDTPTAVGIDQVWAVTAGLVEDLRGERRNALLAQIIAGGSISPDARHRRTGWLC